jgi:hypothetical protein
MQNKRFKMVFLSKSFTNDPKNFQLSDSNQNFQKKNRQEVK